MTVPVDAHERTRDYLTEDEFLTLLAVDTDTPSNPGGPRCARARVRVSWQSGFAMVEGFSPGLTLTRTQTIMEGASPCDVRFVRKAVTPGTAGPT
jgi:hypothetical protein